MSRQARRTALVVMLASTALSGCATTTGDTGGSNLTAGMAKTEIVEGETTQARILEVFGAPNLVTLSSERGEVWNYQRMAFESASSGAGVLAILWPASTIVGGGAHASRASSTTRSFDLILVFDDDDVVVEYTVIQAVYQAP